MTYTARGNDVLVNQTITGNQRLSEIEALADGKFEVIYYDTSNPAGGQ